MSATAEELHDLALKAQLDGHLVQAQGLLEEALRSVEDEDRRARIELSLAFVTAETTTADAGLTWCRTALERQGISETTRGLVWSQLALLHLRNGDVSEGLAAFDQAIPLLGREHEHLGRAYVNRGNLHLGRSNPEAAKADLARAMAELDAAGAPTDAAKARHNLGYAHLLGGDIVSALKEMDQAAEVLSPLSPAIRAVNEQDRAEVLLAAGRTTEAVQALESATAAYAADGLSRYQAECELVLARTLLNEDPGRARDVAKDAARRFRKHGSESWALRADAVSISAEIGSGSRAVATLRRADVVVDALRADGHSQDADRLALRAAHLAVRRGALQDAATRLNRTRVTSESNIATRLLALEVRAELDTARGHQGRARASARKGLAELHAWQATFGSLDLLSSAAGHGQHLARLGLRAAMADRRPGIVFEWSERARALASRVTALRPPPDPGLAADLTALRVADPGDFANRRRLRDRIRAHSWFAAQGTVGEPTDLETLQTLLAVDDSALIAHIVLDGTLTALAVTATEAVVLPLGEAAPVRTLLDRIAADLDFAAQNRGSPMGDAVKTSLRADLAKVSDVLIRPTLATVGYRRLVLTPSALLSGTPWTELPGLIGRPITVPTSATSWLAAAERPIGAVRETGFLAGPRLARAEEEVRRAHDSWPRGHVLAGAEADSARAGWLAARTDLLHIAGHGSHPGDHPLFAAVELADGPWFGHDIDLLPRVPEVVVLSACDLGQSSVLHGEEAVGMSAVWLHAGARTVISSLALLADDLACEVFASWHQLVASGTAPADALAQVSASTDDIVPLLCFGAGW